jgi:hypothetical protein
MFPNIDNVLCRKDGNPFNTTTAPLPSPTSPLMSPLKPPPAGPAPPFFKAPDTQNTPGKQADGPSTTEESNSGKSKKSLTTKQVVGISVAGFFVVIVLVLGVLLLIPKFSRRREMDDRFSKRHQIGAYEGNRQNPGDNGSLFQPNKEKGKNIIISL